MRIVKFKGGVAINGSWPDAAVVRYVLKYLDDPWVKDKQRLSIADPPYGKIVKKKWDAVQLTAPVYGMELVKGIMELARVHRKGECSYWWGGIGKYKFRPFLYFIPQVETHTDWHMVDWITWRKKRGYGVQNKYLFVREELAYFCLGGEKPTQFDIPYLNEERGYAGFNPKYPAKSKYLRRTNVWSDITEILRGKVHEAQKPEALSEIPITAHTNRGDVVLDLYSGSGSCSIAARRLERRFIAVEKSPEEFEKLLDNIRKAS